MTALSKRQTELLERVCLKRYRVQFDHYMGSFRRSESVSVFDTSGSYERPADYSFRPSTAEALRSKGLVRYASTGASGTSIVKPTREGLEHFSAHRLPRAHRTEETS